MQSDKKSSHFISIGMNFGITVLCIVPTWIIISELEFTHEEQVVEGEMVGSKIEQLEPEGDRDTKVESQ